MVVGQNSLVVLLNNVFWNAFHAKDLDIKACSVGESIIDCSEVLFVDLTHMYAQT